MPGASLFGVPLILIGHTRTWRGATRSPPRTGSRLRVEAGPRHADDLPRRRQPSNGAASDGAGPRPTAASSRARARCSRPVGPVFTSLLGLPCPWTPTTAYALADANATTSGCSTIPRDRPRPEHRELDVIERRYQGIPWVNTIAADSRGAAYYADIGTVPHVTDEQVARCNTTALGRATFARTGCRCSTARGRPAAGAGPRRRRARDPRARAAAVAAPRRLRDELQRLLLAVEPRDSRWRASADHRRRADGAHAAHAHRPADHGRRARQAPFTRRCCRTRCSTTASTRAS